MDDPRIPEVAGVIGHRKSGDAAFVLVHNTGPYVILGGNVEVRLTPAEARKLATQLRRLARRAEQS